MVSLAQACRVQPMPLLPVPDKLMETRVFHPFIDQVDELLRPVVHFFLPQNTS
ncbi:hypothetical protein D3C87_2163560 [compost metagenome]